MNNNKKKKIRIRIVDKHAKALLEDLRKHGIDALAVGGCIILGESTMGSGSDSHVFINILPGVSTVEGGTDMNVMLTDMGLTMARSDIAKGSG